MNFYRDRSSPCRLAAEEASVSACAHRKALELKRKELELRRREVDLGLAVLRRERCCESAVKERQCESEDDISWCAVKLKCHRKEIVEICVSKQLFAG